MKNLKNEMKRSAKKLGLPVVGDFIIMLRNDDVISGIALDGAPSATYIWTFVLPAYDNLEFLHMTLGERILRCTVDSDCLALGLNEYRKKILDIKTAKDIVEYIEGNGFDSEYANWAKIISIIRETEHGDISITEEYSFRNHSIIEKYEHLRSVLKSEGWFGARNLLDEWSERTGALLVGVPYNS